MSESTRASGFWVAFGKVSAVVAVLGTLVAIAVALFPAGPRLGATATMTEYHVMPSVSTGIEHLRALLDPELGGEPAISLSSSQSAEVGAAIDMIQPRHDFGARTLVVAEIVNTGNRTAEQVALYVPEINQVSVQGGDTTGTATVVEDRVELGSMRPGSRASVVVWTDSGSYLLEDEVRLAHNSGEGKIRFTVPVTGMFATLAEVFAAIGWSLPAMLAAIILGATASTYLKSLLRREHRRRHVLESSEQSGEA